MRRRKTGGRKHEEYMAQLDGKDSQEIPERIPRVGYAVRLGAFVHRRCAG